MPNQYLYEEYRFQRIPIFQGHFVWVCLCECNVIKWVHFFYKQPVDKQPVLRPQKNQATFEAQI